MLVLLAAGGAGAFLLTRPPKTGIATGPGVLDVETTPPGAAIWLDGDRRSERTPATLRQLPVGATYTVKLAADGYAPHVEQVRLTTAEPHGRLQATLERPSADSFAVVNVRTIPAGAHVLFDGTDTSETTPATVPRIEPGIEHTLVLTLDGYVTRSVPLTLRAGQAEDLVFELERTPLTDAEAILRLVTEPDDARVQLDGRWYDTGSPYEFRVQARAYRLVVAKSGYRPDEQHVELPGGEVTETTVRLHQARRTGGNQTGSSEVTPTASGPGQLTFDARPWCQVSIDGSGVGQTPIVNRTLPSGHHRITCTNPDLGVTRTVNVEIRPGETTRQRISLE